MCVELVFNRCWRDVFAFVGFKEFFQATRDFELAVGTVFPLVAGAEVAIVGEDFSIQVGPFVVAHHLTG